MRRDHLVCVLLLVIKEWIAVVGAIADQILRLGLDHVEVEAQLYQPNLVVIGGMRADRERQSMTIHDCHDFHAFPTLLGFLNGASADGYAISARAFRQGLKDTY